MRLNVATAFDCPFDGPVDPSTTLALLDELVGIRPEAEVCLCDTTGRVTPDRVHALMSAARARFTGFTLPDYGIWSGVLELEGKFPADES